MKGKTIHRWFLPFWLFFRPGYLLRRKFHAVERKCREEGEPIQAGDDLKLFYEIQIYYNGDSRGTFISFVENVKRDERLIEYLQEMASCRNERLKKMKDKAQELCMELGIDFGEPIDLDELNYEGERDER